MHALLLPLLIPLTQPVPLDAASPAPLVVIQDTKKDDAEYEKRKNEAGEDPSKLWKLHEWCKEKGRDKDSKTALRKIVKVDPSHKEANIALGNVFFDGKWFANEKKVEEYKKEKDLAEKKKQGLVEWKGEWVPAADVPYLEKGLVKDDAGEWVDADAAKKLAEGWVRDPDGQWIPPAEKENLANGLWKCGDQWLSLDDANKYHAEIGRWWTVPFEHFTVYSTCDRQVITDKIAFELNRACVDLEKVYGAELKKHKPVVLVLRDQQQYARYAAPEEGDERLDTDLFGYSSVHYARVAENGFDEATFQDLAVGVAYWDATSEAGNKWGACAARHALGQSFGASLDPSPKAVEKVKKDFEKYDPRKYGPDYMNEKRIPQWVRYGAATYAERYYTDPTPGLGGDAQWARKWSVGNIVTKGGLRSLKQIFEFKLNVSDPNDAGKLINESGLLIAFCVDGGHKTVGEKWIAARDAIVSGKDKKAVSAAVTALQGEIEKAETDLRKFAGL